MADRDDKLKVFVSYSRDDIEFAEQLVLALEKQGFETLLDRHDIDAAETWKQRLVELIFRCDTVVFVLTPSSAASTVCAWEVAEAARLGKRMIPILPEPVEGVEPPPQLADLNYIYFYADPKNPGSGPFDGLFKLDQALRVDLAWLREATRMAEAAAAWRARAGSEDRLLRGDALKDAEAWRARAPADAEIQPETIEFLAASADVEVRRLAEAQAELAERQQALQEREAALAAEKAAVAEKSAAEEALRTAEIEAARERETAARRVARRTRIGAAVALVLAVGAIGASIVASNQSRQARAQRDAALVNESRFLATQSQEARARGEVGDALALALAALPQDENLSERPLTAEALRALTDARTELRELASWYGHEQMINGLAFSPDGRILVTGSDDRTARIWRSETGEELAVLRGHESRVSDVAFSPDGARVATGGSDGSVRIWDVESAEPVAVLEKATRYVAQLRFNADGTKIVVNGFGSSVVVWDIETGTRVPPQTEQESGTSHIAFSNDLTFAVAGLPDGKGEIVNVETGERVAELSDSVGRIVGAAFSTDGAWVATGGEVGVLRIWDATTGERLAELRVHDSGWIGKVSFNADNTRIVTSGEDRTARIWKRLDEEGRSWTEELVLRGHTGSLSGATLSRDEQRVITWSADDDTVRLWDAASGEALAVMAGLDGDLAAVAISPDATRAAVGGFYDGSIRVLDVSYSPSTDTYIGPDAPLGVVRFNADRSALMMALEDFSGSTMLWDRPTGNVFDLTYAHGNLIHDGAFNATGDRVIVGLQVNRGVIWERLKDSSGQWTDKPGLLPHEAAVTSVAFSPDGTLALTGTAYPAPGVHLWNAETGAHIATLEGHDGAVWDVTFSPDGKKALSGSQDSTARMWNTETGEELLVINTQQGEVQRVYFSPNGDTILTATEVGLTLWDAAAGELVAWLDVPDPTVSEIAFSPDGLLIAASFSYLGARVWSPKTGEQIVFLDGERGSSGARSIAFDATGDRIVAAGVDGTARVWDAQSGDAVVFLRGHEGAMRRAVFTQDGKSVLTVSYRGVIREWPIWTDAASFIRESADIVSRINPLTFDELCRYNLQPDATCDAPPPADVVQKEQRRISRMFEQGAYSDAHRLSTEIVSMAQEAFAVRRLTRAQLSGAQGALAWAELLVGQPERAERAARDGLDGAPYQRWISTNLAHALLYQGRNSEAEQVYKRLAEIKQGDDEVPWLEVIRRDFEMLSQAGFEHPQMEHILELMADASSE